MGGTRALIAHRWPSGAVTYVNDGATAQVFIAELAKAAAPSSGVASRAGVVEAGLRAQELMGGAPSLASAIRDLRFLNRLVNEAKHAWPQPGAPAEEGEPRAGQLLLAAAHPEASGSVDGMPAAPAPAFSARRLLRHVSEPVKQETTKEDMKELAAKERRKPHVQEPRVQQPQCGSPEAGVAEVTLLDGQSRNEKECVKTKEEEKEELGVQAPLSSWDPAGLTTGGDAGFRRRRDTEVRHGHISMLATLGYVAPVCAGKHPDMWSSPAGLMRATRELLARALGMEACGAVVDYAGAVAGSGGIDAAELVGADCTRKSAKKQRKRNKKVSVENVHEVDVKGKKVLVLCDPHVPGATDPQTPDVAHFTASLFTIEYLGSKGAIVIVCSHLGRPEVGPGAGPSPDSTAKRLGELMGKDIKCALDCTAAEEVKAAVDAMAEGDVIFLETTCIVNEEEVGGPERAESWAGLADLFVHDAVGFARRAHWSAEGATMERGLVSPTRPHCRAGDGANTPGRAAAAALRGSAGARQPGWTS
mmetsp:Transcript_62289/g.193292  ORF Transcript_62289/g.193292 Transcript_62289/m.193292 type:complete len:532 (+) Transcript_62289:71-1666(+)